MIELIRRPTKPVSNLGRVITRTCRLIITGAKALRPRRGESLYPYFRGEFRAYGLWLARGWACVEAEHGISNPHRERASEDYMLALEDLTIAHEVPDDGSTYGHLSTWFPEGPHSRSDLIELAERDADVALLRYSAPQRLIFRP
jgi:hypothetical protein